MEEWGNEDMGYLADAVGKNIQIERGGPDKMEGILQNCQGDCLTMLTQNGIVYVNAEHVKSVTLPLIPVVVVQQEGADGTQQEPVRVYETVSGNSFYEVVENLKHRMVKINQGGPNSLQGVLLQVRPEAVTLVHQMKEYVHFPMYHIKSISLVTENQNQNENKNKDENKNEKKNENRAVTLEEFIEPVAEERRERRDEVERSMEERKSSRSAKRTQGRRGKRYSQMWPTRFND